MIAQELTVEGRCVKVAYRGTGYWQVVLLSTPINQIIGETIKWRIKIVDLQNCIYLGLGLKTVLQNNDFLWKSNKYN